MGTPPHALSKESEVAYLESLRSRYEAEGYELTIAPDQSILPSFFGSYAPDALAQKGDKKIAIEVKSRQSQAAQSRLQDIRRLLEGHPDWQLSVLYIEGGPPSSVMIPAMPPASIRKGMTDVRTLSEQGFLSPAFVMAWSLLEATYHSLSADKHGKPSTPGTVVQALAMNGHISAEIEQELRKLIPLRNRIVHGDLQIEPSKENVELLLAILAETLKGTVESTAPAFTQALKGTVGQKEDE
jgi:uncharacterized protein YutE (UPF0331/DUF86 family)